MQTFLVEIGQLFIPSSCHTGVCPQWKSLTIEILFTFWYNIKHSRLLLLTDTKLLVQFLHVVSRDCILYVNIWLCWKLALMSHLHVIAQIRSRVFNLKDKKNTALRENVLCGSIEPEKFAAMTSEEMASDVVR